MIGVLHYAEVLLLLLLLESSLFESLCGSWSNQNKGHIPNKQPIVTPITRPLEQREK